MKNIKVMLFSSFLPQNNFFPLLWDVRHRQECVDWSNSSRARRTWILKRGHPRGARATLGVPGAPSLYVRVNPYVHFSDAVTPSDHGVKSYGDLFTWASKIPCRHVFFVRLRCLDDLEKFMSTWSEFPWNYQGETSFSIEESTNSRLRKLFMSSQWPLFFFSSFLVFEGFAYIYGFLITWGTPF